MPMVTGNVNIADVHKVLERAAQHILESKGDDAVVSRADIETKLESLEGDERVLVDMFYRFADKRDAAPGARITKSDIDKTLEYAKRKLVERLDTNADQSLDTAEIARMSRIGKLAVAIAQAGATGGAGGATGPAPSGPVTFPAEVNTAIANDLIDLRMNGDGQLTGMKFTTDWDNLDITPNIKAVLDAAGGDHLTEITLGHVSEWDSDDSYGDALAAIAERGPFPNLNELFVADVDWDEAEISWIDVGNIDAAFTISPNLENLRVRGGGASFSPVEHEGLESIFFESGGLPGGVVRSLADSTLPNLDDLNLWLGTEDYGATTDIDDVKKLLSTDGMPGLKKLGLKNSDISTDIAKALVDAPILSQLEVVDLGMGTLIDEGAQAILDNKDKFMHLRSIRLDENALSPEMCDKLEAAFGSKVLIGDQSKYQDYLDDPDYVYVSVGE